MHAAVLLEDRLGRYRLEQLGQMRHPRASHVRAGDSTLRRLDSLENTRACARAARAAPGGRARAARGHSARHPVARRRSAPSLREEASDNRSSRDGLSGARVAAVEGAAQNSTQANRCWHRRRGQRDATAQATPRPQAAIRQMILKQYNVEILLSNSKLFLLMLSFYSNISSSQRIELVISSYDAHSRFCHFFKILNNLLIYWIFHFDCLLITVNGILVHSYSHTFYLYYLTLNLVATF